MVQARPREGGSIPDLTDEKYRLGEIWVLTETMQERSYRIRSVAAEQFDVEKQFLCPPPLQRTFKTTRRRL